jgi:hypothetical protein
VRLIEGRQAVLDSDWGVLLLRIPVPQQQHTEALYDVPANSTSLSS